MTDHRGQRKQGRSCKRGDAPTSGQRRQLCPETGGNYLVESDAPSIGTVGDAYDCETVSRRRAG
jgi:hypothetical protein